MDGLSPLPNGRIYILVSCVSLHSQGRITVVENLSTNLAKLVKPIVVQDYIISEDFAH